MNKLHPCEDCPQLESSLGKALATLLEAHGFPVSRIAALFQTTEDATAEVLMHTLKTLKRTQRPAAAALTTDFNF